MSEHVQVTDKREHTAHAREVFSCNLEAWLRFQITRKHPSEHKCYRYIKTTSNARENVQYGHNPTLGVCFHSSTHM